jgi:integrase
MKKRANGEGSLFKQAGRWYLKVTVVDEAGKRIRKTGSGKTKQEAIQNAEKVRQQYKARSFKKITLSAWLDRWVDVYLKSKRVSTTDTYKSIIKNHIKPSLGPFQLSEITPDDAAGLFAEILRTRSANTARLIYDILSAAFRQAVKSEIAYRNIMQIVEKPKAEQVNHKIMTEKEISLFLKRIKESPFYLIYLLIVSAGLRRGEALAAKWENLNFSTGMIIIAESAVKTNSGSIEINQPKSRQSKRSLALPMYAVQELKNAYQAGKSGFIVSRRNRPVHPNELWTDFKKIKLDIGLGDLTIHEIRHSHSAHLLRSRIPLSEVSKRLGHSTIKTTSDIYAHAVPDASDNSAEAIQRVFEKAEAA